MKTPTCFTALLLLSVLVSCTTGFKAYAQQHLRFLNETALDTRQGFYGQHIEVKHRMEANPADSFLLLSIDDRDIIAGSKYFREEKIQVLREFLTFQGDTVRSNKHYLLRDVLWRRPKQKEPFTIEVEALFSFTRMLTVGLPPIEPVIIERETDKDINGTAGKWMRFILFTKSGLLTTAKQDLRTCLGHWQERLIISVGMTGT